MHRQQCSEEGQSLALFSFREGLAFSTLHSFGDKGSLVPRRRHRYIYCKGCSLTLPSLPDVAETPS
jgi:hypothetical protein